MWTESMAGDHHAWHVYHTRFFRLCFSRSLAMCKENLWYFCRLRLYRVCVYSYSNVELRQYFGFVWWIIHVLSILSLWMYLCFVVDPFPTRTRTFFVCFFIVYIRISVKIQRKIRKSTHGWLVVFLVLVPKNCYVKCVCVQCTVHTSTQNYFRPPYFIFIQSNPQKTE